MAAFNTIKADKLEKDPPSTLLDVRLKEDFDASHLPNAVSNCIFEVAFFERLDDSEEDKAASHVVYGANGKSSEAEMAAERLQSLGFTEVSILEGGIEAWKEAGHPVEGSGEEPADPEVPEGTLSLNLDESFVQWTGRNLLNRHYGTIGLKSGEIEVKEGKLTGGRIVIDMNTMKCDDLEGEMHDGLI
ncbi:MAG: rhodanese-like domain-containing protein, partial [Verrucomicrobiota bacterium]